MELEDPRDVFEKLQQDSIFKEFHKEHPDNYLTHFFCALTPEFKVKMNWEIGFYDSKSEKIVVFVRNQDGFSKKDADQVFKKPGDNIEKLDLSKVKIDHKQAHEIFEKKLPELFPNQQLGDGFLILQSYKGKELWNCTFITKQIKFINIKINVEDGKIESHQEVNLIDKQNAN